MVSNIILGNMQLFCAQKYVFRLWSSSWVLAYFILHYKVPDLTSGVESGGDGPAFADNVIVVEGCFLRISIEGLKV